MNSEVCKVHFARKGEPEMGLTFIVSCTKHVLVELYHLPLPSPSVSPPRSSSLNDSANVAVRSNPSMASRNGSIGEAPPFPPLASIQFPTSPDEDNILGTATPGRIPLSQMVIPGCPQRSPSPPLPSCLPILSMVIPDFPREWISTQSAGSVSLPCLAQIVLPDSAIDDSMHVEYGDLRNSDLAGARLPLSEIVIPAGSKHEPAPPLDNGQQDEPVALYPTCK